MSLFPTGLGQFRLLEVSECHLASLLVAWGLLIVSFFFQEFLFICIELNAVLFNLSFVAASACWQYRIIKLVGHLLREPLVTLMFRPIYSSIRWAPKFLRPCIHCQYLLHHGTRELYAWMRVMLMQAPLTSDRYSTRAYTAITVVLHEIMVDVHSKLIGLIITHTVLEHLRSFLALSDMTFTALSHLALSWWM